MKTQAIIFDMDGLMFDTERLYIEGFKYVGEKTGAKFPEESLLKLVGMNYHDGVKLFNEEFGSTPSYEECFRINDEYIENYMKTKGIPCKPGLHELLDYLATNDYKIALATSTKEETARYYLELADVTSYFDVIVCGDMITRGKPDPEIFLLAASKLGTPPENCLILEDSRNGIIAAHSAGIPSILVPDLIVPTAQMEEYCYKKVKTLFNVIDILEEQNR